MTATAHLGVESTARLIDGRALAADMRKDLRRRVNSLSKRCGIVPGLAVVLVGDDPASAIYVANKVRACAKVGIESRTIRRGADVTTEELLSLIAELNFDPDSRRA